MASESKMWTVRAVFESLVLKFETAPSVAVKSAPSGSREHSTGCGRRLTRERHTAEWERWTSDAGRARCGTALMVTGFLASGGLAMPVPMESADYLQFGADGKLSTSRLRRVSAGVGMSVMSQMNGAESKA
jgi:hypothetical protein